MPRSASLALPHRPLRLAAGIGIVLGIALLIALVLYAIAAAAAGETGGTRSAVDLPTCWR